MTTTTSKRARGQDVYDTHSEAAPRAQTKSRRAKIELSTKETLPGGHKRMRGASALTKPNQTVPRASNNGNGEGTRGLMIPTSALSPAVPALVGLQRKRVSLLRAILTMENQCRAYVRRLLGFTTFPKDAAEKKRMDAIRDLCGKTTAALLAGKPAPDAFPREKLDDAQIFVVAASLSLRAWSKQREQIQKDMIALAATLPGQKFIEATRGLGIFGLAVIVGEAGDLRTYANPAKLWKRAGLAPPDAYLAPDKNGKMVRMIPKRRRSAFWTLGDALLKSNDGKYRALYNARKEYEHSRNPTMTKMHAHRRAQRYMEKTLLKDLWCEWNNGAEDHDKCDTHNITVSAP